METKTKQRWIGLLVLIAILAIFLPLLFHNTQQNTSPELSVNIPPKPTTIISNHLPKTSIQENSPTNKKPKIPSVNIPQSAAVPTTESKQKPPVSQADITKKVKLLESLPQQTESKTTTQPSKPLEAWVVQLGTFGDANNAKQLIQKLRNKGFDAYARQTTDKTGRQLTRIFVGPEADKNKANHLASVLKNDFHINGLVREYEIKENL